MTFGCWANRIVADDIIVVATKARTKVRIIISGEVVIR
jgi:hypothetical protein